MFEYHCIIQRVIDGDTVEAEIDLGFDCFYKSPVRLKGINAPELKGRTTTVGRLAKDYLFELLHSGPVTVTTELRKDKDKYGRVLGTFYANGRNINQEMIDAGHAVSYMSER